MDTRIRAALERDRTIDITTTGARSGTPRRIEIWFHRVEGRFWITGRPGRRDWLANLKAHPEFVVHLKGTTQADVAAVARVVEDPDERRRILEPIALAVGLPAEALVASGPLAEFTVSDDEA